MTVLMRAKRPRIRFRRQELKYWIDLERADAIRKRIQSMMRPDSHAGPGPHGAYRVDSAYLETPDTRCYLDKLDGVEHRRKFRIRVYGPEDPAPPPGSSPPV